MRQSKVTHRQKMDLSASHPRRDRCVNLTDRGAQCEGDGLWRVTRADGTSYLLCTPHKNWLMDQMAKRPDAYKPVTFQQLT